MGKLGTFLLGAAAGAISLGLVAYLVEEFDIINSINKTDDNDVNSTLENKDITTNDTDKTSNTIKQETNQTEIKENQENLCDISQEEKDFLNNGSQPVTI